MLFSNLTPAHLIKKKKKTGMELTPKTLKVYQLFCLQELQKVKNSDWSVTMKHTGREENIRPKGSQGTMVKNKDQNHSWLR